MRDILSVVYDSVNARVVATSVVGFVVLLIAVLLPA